MEKDVLEAIDRLHTVIKDINHNTTLNSKEIVKLKNVIVAQEEIIQHQNEKIKLIHNTVVV